MRSKTRSCSRGSFSIAAGMRANQYLCSSRSHRSLLLCWGRQRKWDGAGLKQGPTPALCIHRLPVQGSSAQGDFSLWEGKEDPGCCVTEPRRWLEVQEEVGLAQGACAGARTRARHASLSIWMARRGRGAEPGFAAEKDEALKGQAQVRAGRLHPWKHLRAVAFQRSCMQHEPPSPQWPLGAEQVSDPARLQLNPAGLALPEEQTAAITKALLRGGL